MVGCGGDGLVGEETLDKRLEVVGKAAKGVEEDLEETGEALNGVKDGVRSFNETWGGIGTFLGNLTGGNGLNMFGNFFANLGHGNVSGLGILGLVASALLVFGRFGWLGKIAGLLMGMMLIGNNSKVERSLPAVQPLEEGQNRQGGMRR